MKFNVYIVVVVVVITCVHIVGITSQHRNSPNTRNSYYRSAVLPRPSAKARVQRPPQQAVRSYAPQAQRRTQRQSQAPTYVQTVHQVRPAPAIQGRVQNVLPVYAQRSQRPQRSARPQQPAWFQQSAQPQQRQPQAVASAVATATATAGGPDFRGAFGEPGYGTAGFEGPGFNGPGFNGLGHGGPGHGGPGHGGPGHGGPGHGGPGHGGPGHGGPGFGNGRGKGKGQGKGKGKGNKYHPHRPHPNLYRNFASVYKDIDSRADDSDYNATAEMDEINDDFNGRSIVAPGQYPHMAALGFRTASGEIEFKCGGSLISEVFVLTAAHCCYFNGQIPDVVKIGDIKLKEFELDNRPQRRRVAEVMLHPAYNSTMHYHDIAIILLNRPIVHTYFVRPIRLWVSDEIPYDKVYTMGYGSTSFAQAPTNVLTELDLSVVPWQQCNASLPVDENAPFGIVESQICAKDYEKNRDTCQGDSGGPLQLNLLRRRGRRRFRYYLVGITSYGTFCRSPFPGVYTRVSSYIDWITSVVWPDYFNNFFG